MSDTHGHHESVQIPDGDVIIHSGDYTKMQSMKELHKFAKWFGGLPHKHKIFVPGNHDECFEKQEWQSRNIMSMRNVETLIDNSITLDNIKFYGTPQQPIFQNWAFNKTSEKLADYYAGIPNDTDVLITHTPPFWVLDRLINGDNVGSLELAEAVKKVQPKIHVFGHIHASYGKCVLGNTQYINASICGEGYEAENTPIVTELHQNKGDK